ncbi:MAG: hypothetical protein O3A13_06150 [Proteobacteria bacterium]|jgi:hypothetical protein|nr:hypothetical protein [Pseudomonadota bacterium]
MIRKIAAVVLGAFVAIALIAIVEYLGHQIYPPPPDLDITDKEAFKTYSDSLPAGAFLVVGIAWMIGVFGGGMLATMIAREAAVTNCTIVGGLVLAGTIMTIISIPHPLWFSVGSIIAIIATIFLTSQVAAVFVVDTITKQNISD